jgi:heat-inducible transcriptional repressor
MQGLEKRSEQILKAITWEYILSGEPVGSRTLSKKEHIGLSAASIRNIMSDLTESGYIMQPHVSAGRVPTDRGYRFYVDTIAQPQELGWDEQATIESLIQAAGLDVRDVLRQSSSVLAGLSSRRVVTSTAAVEQTFKTIEFARSLTEFSWCWSPRAASQNKLSLTKTHQSGGPESYSRMLNDMLKDLDLREARERIEHELAWKRPRLTLC